MLDIACNIILYMVPFSYINGVCIQNKHLEKIIDAKISSRKFFKDSLIIDEEYVFPRL